MRKKVLKSGTIEIRENGVVVMEHYNNSKIDLEELLLREQAIQELFQGKSYPILIDLRDKFVEYAPAARHHTDNNRVVDHLIKAEAFLVSGIGIKMLIMDHIANNQGGFPIRLFDDKKLAIEWLQGFV